MTNIDRIFPPWKALNMHKQPLLPGERFLAEHLDKNLPKSWKIFLKTKLNHYKFKSSRCFGNGSWGGVGKSPDIVIAHETGGIMIIEVKDWVPEKYKCNTLTTGKGKKIHRITTTKNGKEILLSNPIHQVEEYRNLLFEGIPEIDEEIYQNKEKFNLIKIGLYFHKSTTKEAKQIVGPYDSFKCKVFGKEALETTNSIERIIPLLTLLKSQKKVTMGKEWFKKFHNWVMPPWHTINDGIYLSFNTKQKRYINPKPNSKQKLTGVAGSGKTLVLAMRAANLAAQGKRVLVVCFNITLRHYIKKQTNKARAKFSWEKIYIMHFDGFCKRYALTHGMPFPFDGTDEENIQRHRKNIISHRENNNNYLNYDAILVDEGNDFEKEWYEYLCSFLTENNEILFAIDEKQNIYKRELNWVGRGRWGILNGVLNQGLRLPIKQIKIINNFSKTFLKDFNNKQENPEISIPEEKQLSLLPSICKSYWINVKDFTEIKNNIYKVIQHLVEKLSMKISDVVILVNRHEEGIELRNYIKKQFGNKFSIMDIFSMNSFHRQIKKRYFRINTPHLKMSTFHSFKGWEARNVIIVIPEDQKSIEVMKKFDLMIYSSLTRTQENLFIINQSFKYQQFGAENFENTF